MQKLDYEDLYYHRSHRDSASLNAALSRRKPLRVVLRGSVFQHLSRIHKFAKGLTIVQIVLGNTIFTWTLKHERRQSTKMKISGPALIDIIAPPGYKSEQAEAFIRSKADWIIATGKKLAAEALAAAEFSAAPGGILPFMGDNYVVTVAYHPVRPSVRLDGSLLRVCLPPDRQGNQNAVIYLLVNWYAEQARQHLSKKTLSWARKIGVNPVSVTIRNQKSRWGSCSSKGSINYNWRVMFAPPQVIDYLVVHELCHLIEPNHSDRFWRLVGSFLPDYKASRSWLKQHGGVLMRLLLDLSTV